AIVLTLLLGLMRLLGVGPRAAAASAMALLVFYGDVTGFPASVARAISAAVIYLGARLIDHRGPPLNALAVAATGALAVSPAAAADPGFLLSFGATLGILLGAPALLASLPGVPRAAGADAADRRSRAADVLALVLRKAAGALSAIVVATV